MRHDRGLAASPPVRDILKVELGFGSGMIFAYPGWPSCTIACTLDLGYDHNKYQRLIRTKEYELQRAL